VFRLLILCLVLCFSCQKSSSGFSKQILKVNIGTDPQTLDPRKARKLTDSTVVRMLFEGLTRIAKDGDTELALATDVEVSLDGLQYCFHLRKSFWSNGEPVTSYDFAESWKTILDPNFPTDIAYQLYPIKNAQKAKLGEIGLDKVGIRVPDELTLIVDLERPVPYFLNLVSMPCFYPVYCKAANRSLNWGMNLESYVCNGPFFPLKWRHSDHLQLAKNPYYWQSKEVSLSGIQLFMVSGETELRMYESGGLDWAGSPLSSIPVDAMQALKQSNQLHVSPFFATCFFRTNTSDVFCSKKNPLSSPNFRKALSSSLHRKEITEHILQGDQIPAMGLVPTEMQLSKNGYFYDNNPENARLLLMDALLELDLSIETLEPIKISYASSERNGLIAQAAQKQWEDTLGISFVLDPVEPKVFFQKISEGNFQLALGSWTADFNDPVNFLEIFKYKSSSTNNTNWENSKFIDLLNASGLCKNAGERMSLLREAEQVLMEEMPVIPVYHFVLNYLQSDQLKEVALSPLGQVDFRWARLN
jgi:oligopeptide transport system substrate-binding protein